MGNTLSHRPSRRSSGEEPIEYTYLNTGRPAAGYHTATSTERFHKETLLPLPCRRVGLRDDIVLQVTRTGLRGSSYG